MAPPHSPVLSGPGLGGLQVRTQVCLGIMATVGNEHPLWLPEAHTIPCTKRATHWVGTPPPLTRQWRWTMASLSPPSNTVYLRLLLGAVFILPNSTFFSLTSFRNSAVTPSCPASHDLVKPSAGWSSPWEVPGSPSTIHSEHLGFSGAPWPRCSFADCNYDQFFSEQFSSERVFLLILPHLKSVMWYQSGRERKTLL